MRSNEHKKVLNEDLTAVCNFTEKQCFFFTFSMTLLVVKMSAHCLINILVFLFSAINCKTNEVKQNGDSFREELFIKPLQNGHIYSYFQFTTVWNANSRLNPCMF